MSDAASAHPATPWPTEVKVVDGGRRLRITFEDGARFELPAEYLRVSSPSAEVKGHSRKERRIVGGKRHVTIVGVEPVGTYAVKLTFDDRHATGLYTWAYLHELGSDQAAKWATYVEELEAKGLSREKPGERTVDEH